MRHFEIGEKVKVIKHHINRAWNCSPVEVEIVGYSGKYRVEYAINGKVYETHQANLRRV